MKTSPQKSCYIHLLQCMHQIAKMSRPAASSFFEKFIHREILQEIKITFYSYKKGQELTPNQSKGETSVSVGKRYKLFAAQIDLIASLLNAEESFRESILKEAQVNELLQVLTHNNVDPILLTSVCYLAE